MIKMKKYFTLLLFIGLAWCQMQGKEAGKVNFQNLIFYNIEDTIMNFMFKVDEEKAIFLDRIHKILLKDSVLNEEIRKHSKSLN